MSRLDELRAMRDFIDREIAAEVRLRIESETPPPPLDTRGFIVRAADLYGVRPDQITSGTRRAQVVRARQAAAWLMHRAGMSYPSIGAVLGLHHTTALYACRKIDGSPTVRALLVGLEVVA